MFIVIEMQTNTDGSLGNLVYKYNTKAEAESKYHAILSAAAISSLPVHTALMTNEYGMDVKSQYYIHEQTVEVE